MASLTLRQPARPASTAASGGAGAAAAAPPAAEAVLIASDKFGDAFAFPDPDVGSKKRWLLGHTGSIVTALAGSLDSRFLLSADREERIRVSHFPAAYNVESFCLGHTRFVTALHVLRQGVPLPGWGAASPAAAEAPSPAASSSASAASSSSAADASAPFPSAAAAVASADAVAAAQHAAAYAPGELLVSAGAEGALRLWHWRSGTLLHTVYLQPGEDIVYAKGVTLRRHTLPPLNGAVSGGASAVGSGSGAPAPVSSSGPLPLDDDGQYGCLSAVGSHADSDMNRMENSDEAEMASSSSAADASSAAASSAAASVAGEAEAAADSAAADAAAETADAGSSAGAGAGALDGVEAVPGGAASVSGKVIPKAWEGSERPQGSARHATPPVLPGEVHECGATGLLATVVDGEHAVRLLGVGAGELGDAIPAPRSNAPASLTSQCSPGLAATVIGDRLPQARLSQVAVLRTPFRPLALRFLGSGHASAAPAADAAAAGAVTHLLLGYAERQGEAAAEASFRLAVVRLRQAAGAVSAARLSDEEVAAQFPLVAAANTRLADIPLSAGVATATHGSGVGSSKAPAAAAPAPAEAPEVLVRSNAFAASLEEYDKHWNVYKPRAQRAGAGAGAGDAAAADAGDL